MLGPFELEICENQLEQQPQNAQYFSIELDKGARAREDTHQAIVCSCMSQITTLCR